jgi:hypothetical protein
MTAAHPCSEKGVRPCRPDTAAPLACDRHGGRSPVHETRPSSSSCAPCKANGEVCADNDTCCSNLCNAFECVGPNSIEALKPCAANAACISGDCVAGFWAQVCGDGSCDGIERCRDKNSGVECLSDCGRCPNGDVCIDGADCQSRNCCTFICRGCECVGFSCSSDSQYCSGSCSSIFSRCLP